MSSGSITLGRTINAGGVSSISTIPPLSVIDPSTTPSLSISQTTSNTNGYLSFLDWNTFNSKFNLPSLTAGSLLFSDGTTIAQNNTNLFWENSTAQFFIGTNPTASPGDNGQLNIESVSGNLHSLNVICRATSANAVEIQLQNGANLLDLTQSATTAPGGASITCGRSRGNINSRSQMLAGDVYGGLFFQGYGTSFSGYGAAVVAVALENITSTASGSELLFLTSSLGQNNVANTCLTLNASGNAIFGGKINATSITASRVVVTDASNNLLASTTTATEIGFVSGVTSSIQSQLNSTPYTAGTPSDWSISPPTNIQTAINRIADLLKILNGGNPIP